MANTLNSYSIKAALANKHRGEFFMTEVKNGPTQTVVGGLLQFDGVAIYKSWTRPCIRGYEIKISRSDFLRDSKYAHYIPYFHEFYFVVPQGMVKREEVEDGIGLMYYNPDTGKLTTKRQAVYRKIELDASFLYYIIMYRLNSDRVPFMTNKEEVFRAWLEGKETNKQLSYKVQSKLLKDNAELQRQLSSVRIDAGAEKKLEAVREVLYKRGVPAWGNLILNLDQALSRNYPPELDKLEKDLEAARKLIDSIKRRDSEDTHD